MEAPSLARLPRGRLAPVLVLPGFGTGDASTTFLRTFLSLLGYTVSGWGIGRNEGDVPRLVPRVIARTADLVGRHGGRVRMVGWSLGGVLAREAARERPDLVERVVTLGSPVVGGPKYTRAARYYRRRGVDLDRLEREIAKREERPIAVPITAIYSRRDGVVAWRACIDRVNRSVEHVEVAATHTGLGFSATVYRILAERLALGLEEEDAGSGTEAEARLEGAS